MLLLLILTVLSFALLPVAALGVVVDLRNKGNVYEGGSSRVAVYLTADQAQEAFADATAVAGWYQPSYQESTQVGPERETEELKDEADNLIRARTTSDNFLLITTFFQTDEDTIRLLDWLEDAENAVPLRYPMPTNDEDEMQWVFLYAANVRKEDWRIEASRGAVRSRQVTFTASRNEEGRLREIVTLPNDQGDAAWADYEAFSDTPPAPEPEE
jgi:hypothetical protein